MSSSDFNPEELVSFQGKKYPVVGGRLRLFHEDNPDGIQTEVVNFFPEESAVVKATVTAHANEYTGHGQATAKRDGRLKDALLELAETRAIARALRFAGYGVEYTGDEEISHLKGKSAPAPVVDSDAPSSAQRATLRTLAKELEEVTGEPVKMESPKTLQEAKALIEQLRADLGRGESS